MKCRNCGRQIPDNSIFCNWCGEKQLKERKKKQEIRVPKPRQLPSGSWFIYMRVNGVDYPITQPTEDECITAAKAVKAGLLDASPRVDRGDTLRTAMDAYLSSRSNVLSPSTIRGYKQIRDNHFASVMDKPIPSVDWQKAVDAEAESVAPKTVKNCWAFASRCIGESGHPVPSVRLPKVPKASRPWLTPEEIKVFVKAVDGTDAALPGLLALHSLRRSELYGLMWDQVDLDNKRFTVSGAMVDSGEGFVRNDVTKSAASTRIVPILIPELYAALEAEPDKTGPVLKGGPYTAYKRINKICESAGLPKVGCHGLRHSFASLGYHLRMSEMEVMRLGGWSDYNTVHGIYTHLSDLDAQKAARKMARFYEPKPRKKRTPKASE